MALSTRQMSDQPLQLGVFPPHLFNSPSSRGCGPPQQFVEVVEALLIDADLAALRGPGTPSSARAPLRRFVRGNGFLLHASSRPVVAQRRLYRGRIVPDPSGRRVCAAANGGRTNRPRAVLLSSRQKRPSSFNAVRLSANPTHLLNEGACAAEPVGLSYVNLSARLRWLVFHRGSEPVLFGTVFA